MMGGFFSQDIADLHSAEMDAELIWQADRIQRMTQGRQWSNVYMFWNVFDRSGYIWESPIQTSMFSFWCASKDLEMINPNTRINLKRSCLPFFPLALCLDPGNMACPFEAGQHMPRRSGQRMAATLGFLDEWHSHGWHSLTRGHGQLALAKWVIRKWSEYIYIYTCTYAHINIYIYIYKFIFTHVQ